MKKKILITGASGFLGVNLIRKLSKQKSFIIYGLVNLKTRKFEKIKKVKYIKSDISNSRQLKKKLENNFDYVINFAGNIDHKNKNQTLKTHYFGLKNLINAIQKEKIKRFIQVGSSLEYGNKECPHFENIKCNPISHYGKSKFLSTKFIQKKIKNYIILRPYQIYGSYQKINRLIPLVIDACLKNKSFDCTDGSQYRDFLYVEDFIDLVIKIIKKRKIKEGIYNVGSGKPIKVKKVISSIQKIIKKGKPQFGKIKMRRDESNSSYPNILKIKRNLNWKPKTKFHYGLKKTINFYEN